MARRSTKSAPAPKLGKSGYAVGVKLTDAEADALVPTWIAHLENGGTMQELRAQYGPSERIRKAFYRAGYTNRNRRQVVTISAKAKASTLVNHLVAGRTAGKSWNQLLTETGKTKAEMQAILAKAGKGDLAHGRVRVRPVKQSA